MIKPVKQRKPTHFFYLLNTIHIRSVGILSTNNIFPTNNNIAFTTDQVH